jgi:hypothetical protein
VASAPAPDVESLPPERSAPSESVGLTPPDAVNEREVPSESSPGVKPNGGLAVPPPA